MATSGRGRKTEVDASSLNNVERLIFCQAVYEYGSDAWPKVAQVLSTHSMISRPKNCFTLRTCPLIYTELMDEAQLERSDALAVRHAPLHNQLASIHWQRRILELRTQIAAEESRFKTLVNEIDEIRAGLWDDKIRAQSGLPIKAKTPPPAEHAHEVESPRPEHPPPLVGPEERQGEHDLTAPDAAPQIVDSPSLPAQDAEEPRLPEMGETHPSAQDSDLTSIDQSSPMRGTHLVSDTSSDDIPMVSPDEPEHPQETDAAPDTADAPAAPEPVNVQEDTNVAAEYQAAHELVDENMPAEDQTLLLEEEGAVEVANLDEFKEGLPTRQTESPDTGPIEQIEAIQMMNRQDQSAGTDSVTEPEESRLEGKRKAIDLDDALSDSQRETKRLREESEPVEDEDSAPATGPRRRIGRPPAVDNPTVSKRFQNMIGMLHSQISQHRYGNIFHNPIRKAEAADYHDIVKRPMDLKTIKSRIKDGLISNSLEFQRDVYLMFANAMMYNRPGSEICSMAEEMMQESEGQINTFRQTEGFHRM